MINFPNLYITVNENNVLSVTSISQNNQVYFEPEGCVVTLLQPSDEATSGKMKSHWKPIFTFNVFEIKC